MKYHRTIRLKDGRACLLRNGTEADGKAVFDNFNLTHSQTDYLLSYPEENSYTPEQEGVFLQKKTESADEIEILAEVAGQVVGTAGIEHVGTKEKVRHRAEFGISVDRAFWGLGIGRALTEACIECAKAAGYAQLELEAVADNRTAIALYEREGFAEYGRNPRGFRSRRTGWQELVLMRLELKDPSLHQKTDVLLLNGPSSAGKSSIAAALRKKLCGVGTEAVILALDDYLQMSVKEPIWEDDVFAIMPRMCRDIAAALQAGKTLIVDHVITSPRIYHSFLEAITGFPMKTVLVSCAPEILRVREAARADRCVGSAEASLQYLYPQAGYDLCLDSGETGPEALAERILGIL